MKGLKQADVLTEGEISREIGASVTDVGKRDGKRKGDCEQLNVYRG